MALPFPIVVGVDTFDDVFDTINQIIANVADNAEAVSGQISFKNGASPLFLVDIAPSPDHRVSGLAFSNVGLTVSYTAGAYVYDSNALNVALGAVALSAAATFARYDLIIGDTLGAISVIQGTETINPVLPALAGGTLLAIYYVAIGGIVRLLQTDAIPIVNSPLIGTLDTLVLTENTVLTNTRRRSVFVLSPSTQITLPSAPINGKEFRIKNRSGAAINVISGGFEIDGVASPYALPDGSVLRLQYVLELGEWCIM